MVSTVLVRDDAAQQTGDRDVRWLELLLQQALL